jgi:asparagine synthase (glutamine-hydrolysing)
LTYQDLLPGVGESVLDPILSNLNSAVVDAISALADEPAALGFSGGIDSSILAKILGDSRGNVTLLTLGLEKSSDMESAESALLPNSSKFTTSLCSIDRDDIELAAKKISNMVTVSNLSHYEDCMGFWLLAKTARESSEISYLISANGPDELFCGYDRFRRILDSGNYARAENEISVALKMAENLGSQVKKIASEFGYQIYEPLLLEKFRQVAIQIPIEYKILPNNDLLRKRIWRCFGRLVGLPQSIVFKPKKAMQYGMGIHPTTINLLKHGVIKPEFKV